MTALAGLLSCTSSNQGSVVTKGSGAYIASASELKPDGDPGTRAKMVMSGMIIPVDLKTRTDPKGFFIDLWYEGEKFEEEQYRSTPEEFQLVNAAGETYSPPIPLLRFPMNVGDAWKWS